jgi:hypothetical protein
MPPAVAGCSSVIARAVSGAAKLVPLTTESQPSGPVTTIASPGAYASTQAP